jgi:GT2 family glycosyltransferase
MQDRLAEQYQSIVTGKWETTARQFYTGNASLSRQLFLEHNGFDVALLRAEDIELAFRLTKNEVKFRFCQEAIGYHYEQRTFSSWLSIAFAYGGNDVLFAQEKGQSWLLPNLFKEYNQRNLLVKGLARSCLDRPRLTAAMTWFFKGQAEYGARIGMPTVSRVACSGLFNLYY